MDNFLIQQTSAAPRRRNKIDTPLSSIAYERLEEMIVTQVLTPGAVITEAALGQRLALGRTPIREALQRLAREGLVRILPRRGILVTDISPAHHLGHLEVRRVLERLTARCAAVRASAAERERMLELAAKIDRASRDGDTEAFMRLDRACHDLCVEAAQNPSLESVMAVLQGVSRRFWHLFYRKVGELRQTGTLHAELLRAIARGDADLATIAADRLMDHVEEFTRATLTPQRIS